MSPIFVRPVREQLEHDRLIRFLQSKHKRRFEVGANVGEERVAPLKVGQATVFPDLVLTAGKKVAGVIEVETGESVNNLEAMAQWAPFGRARVPFHLYVPVPVYDVARRLLDANQVEVAELWTYRPAADGFDLVRMVHNPSVAGRAANRPAGGKRAAAKGSRPPKPSSKEPARKDAKKPARTAASKKSAKRSGKR